MVILRELVRNPALGLTLLTGQDALDREVCWAHVSELDDPTPWLEGGEFLLTTGLGAKWDEEHALAYCGRLADFGITALGVSVGPGLDHTEVPDALLHAAERTGLCLVQVAHRTPLQTVVRAVADSINGEQLRPLKSLVDLQQKLTSEAASGSGLQGIVDALRRYAKLHVTIYDVRLRPLTSELPDAPLAPELRKRIRTQMLGDQPGSMAFRSTEWSQIIQPLGVEGGLRGLLVAQQEAAFTRQDQSILTMSAPILSLLLDLKHAADAPNRRARRILAEALLKGGEPAAVVSGQLAAAGLKASTTQVLRARIPSPSQRRAFIAGLSELAADELTLLDGDELTVILCDPVPDIAEPLAALVEEAGASHLGLGLPADPADTHTSHQQAVRAEGVARAQGLPMKATSPQGDEPADSLLGTPESMAAFADHVLAELDAHDAANPRQPLLPTLQAYFDAIGRVDPAAAALQIHRHTMRARLQRVAEITSRDLTVASDYFELWMGVEFRRRQRERIR